MQSYKKLINTNLPVNWKLCLNVALKSQMVKILIIKYMYALSAADIVRISDRLYGKWTAK